MNQAPKIVIATLERHYSPPVPAQLNGRENPTYLLLVADYLTALKAFSDEALELGMRELLNTWKYARWPKPGELASVIRSVEPVRALPSKRRVMEGFWDAVKERRARFVDEFMSGTLARQAQDEGWSDQLREYVRKVAWYQAQIVERCERKGRAFSCRAKDQHGYPLYSKELIEFFQLEDLERHGAMTVSVPAKEIDGMKARARQQAEFAKRAGGFKRVANNQHRRKG